MSTFDKVDGMFIKLADKVGNDLSPPENGNTSGDMALEVTMIGAALAKRVRKEFPEMRDGSVMVSYVNNVLEQTVASAVEVEPLMAEFKHKPMRRETETDILKTLAVTQGLLAGFSALTGTIMNRELNPPEDS